MWAWDGRRKKPPNRVCAPSSSTSPIVFSWQDTILTYNSNDDINPWGCDLVTVIFIFLFDDESLE